MGSAKSATRYHEPRWRVENAEAGEGGRRRQACHRQREKHIPEQEGIGPQRARSSPQSPPFFSRLFISACCHHAPPPCHAFRGPYFCGAIFHGHCSPRAYIAAGGAQRPCTRGRAIAWFASACLARYAASACRFYRHGIRCSPPPSVGRRLSRRRALPPRCSILAKFR